ncbi:hypothetical protein [Longimicrobium sp.]|uniref:hypothetical protein n=1 Tax=Longimicrobium sp. TaxID=2029185 RepID=UPI002ED90481
MLRKVAFGAGLFGAIVVALGWIPGISPHAGHERMMFNAFAISAIDDITHGLTALAAFAAAFHSERASRLFLVTFGSYYALDATFYLLNGFVNDLPWTDDIVLNLPHVVVSTVMLAAAYGIKPRAAERAGNPALA